MRIDVISVFPEFFDVLRLSLLGKAQDKGVLEVTAHDLREWTTDPHRTVDDTPAGGGAGMVMRADVWGRAIDDIVQADGRVVLAIPTPSGNPLTQRMCADLAHASQLVIACGRYEGIDARVAEHYAGRLEVLEYSLGDYVLNGGEVAAVALVEAVGRLVPGVVGNPESLVEESHGEAGLLEYPVYTRPVEWRGHAIPAVLMSGDHGAIERWRREQAIERTVTRRSDMVEALDSTAMTRRDKEALARHGYLVLADQPHPVRATFRRAHLEDAAQVAEVAARTFPDACPPEISESDIAEFIAANLTRECFEEHLSGDRAIVEVVEVAGKIAGYTLTKLPDVAEVSESELHGAVAGADTGAPVDAVVQDHPRRGPMAELSKFYLDRSLRGSGARTLLWEATLDELRLWGNRWPEPYVWLATNIGNRRAQKAYVASGFTYAGKREFMVGDQNNVDRVYVRPILMA